MDAHILELARTGTTLHVDRLIPRGTVTRTGTTQRQLDTTSFIVHHFDQHVSGRSWIQGKRCLPHWKEKGMKPLDMP